MSDPAVPIAFFQEPALPDPRPHWGPGIIRTSEWIALADGSECNKLWAPCWRILPDKLFGPKIRSAEGWFAQAEDAHGNPLALIPGCKVASFVACIAPPESADVGRMGWAA